MNDLLRISLACAVPLYICELLARGGPQDSDWESIRPFAQRLAEHGDRLLFRSEKEGETASLFNDLARALAVMSFLPGGVRFAGEHWESKLE